MSEAPRPDDVITVTSHSDPSEPVTVIASTLNEHWTGKHHRRSWDLTVRLADGTVTEWLVHEGEISYVSRAGV